MTMRLAGTICWVVELVILSCYLHVGKERATPKSLVLKTITSVFIVGYALLLILMYGQGFTTGSRMFVIALSLSMVGDIIFGILPQKYGGNIRDVYGATGKRQMQNYVLICVAGIAFIVSYFLQIIVFLRNMRDALAMENRSMAEFAVPYLVMLAFPILLTAVVGVLLHFELPELPLRILIIGIIYMVFISFIYASASVYAFWYYQTDPRHAAFIFSGAIMYLMGGIIMALRYSKNERYDTPSIRLVGRVLYYLSRMTLAGCAFLF